MVFGHIHSRIPLLGNAWIKKQLPEKGSYRCCEELPEAHLSSG